MFIPVFAPWVILMKSLSVIVFGVKAWPVLWTIIYLKGPLYQSHLLNFRRSIMCCLVSTPLHCQPTGDSLGANISPSAMNFWRRRGNLPLIGVTCLHKIRSRPQVKTRSYFGLRFFGSIAFIVTFQSDDL